MKLDEYQELARRTSGSSSIIEKLTNGVMGLCGESGEVIDIVKKWAFQGHDLYTSGIKEELGDVLWYIAEICDAVGLSLSAVAEANIEKLKKRYPDGFEVEKSINRQVMRSSEPPEEPRDPLTTDMGALVNELRKDKTEGSYYHGWQSVLACAIMVNSDIEHERAN